MECIGSIFLDENGYISINFDNEINSSIIKTGSLEEARELCDVIGDFLDEVYRKVDNV